MKDQQEFKIVNSASNKLADGNNFDKNKKEYNIVFSKYKLCILIVQKQDKTNRQEVIVTNQI